MMENQNEIWLPIEGYGGDYEVSNLGRVKSYKYKATKILRHGIDSDGYCVVGLLYYGAQTTKRVHCLVMAAFEGASNLPIDHKNGNKQDNRHANLRYCTVRQNNTYKCLAMNTSSKFTGVCWNRRDVKWQSNIRICQKLIHLGYFTDEKQAAKAYQTALEMHEVGEVVTGAMVRQKISN